MKFHHRQAELDVLNETYHQISTAAKMVVITGRRRVGKTVLSLKHAEGKPHLYLFITKKSETLLCQEFIKQIKQIFPRVPIIGEITQFQDVFALLLEIAKQQPFVLIIDEFQEFTTINPSIYSDIQRLWDLHKFDSKLQVLFLGSVYSLMHRIFEQQKEPLFGRADRILHLKPFSPKEIRQILFENGIKQLDSFFNYYVYTGGMPKYIDILLTQRVFTDNDMVDFILSKGSPFIEEGKNVLIEEFGKEYGVYFSILELISTGKNNRSEIESILQKDIGGYLERCEKIYSVINKYKPINAKPNSRLQKYRIRDNFLKFWFRFIYRNRSAVESENFDYIKQIIRRDLTTYKGQLLESLFHDLFIESHCYNRVGLYWERDGLNEIDLVALNDLHKKITIAEIKLNKRKISLNILKKKSLKLMKNYHSYDVEYLALSLEDAANYLDR